MVLPRIASGNDFPVLFEARLAQLGARGSPTTAIRRPKIAFCVYAQFKAALLRNVFERQTFGPRTECADSKHHNQHRCGDE